MTSPHLDLAPEEPQHDFRRLADVVGRFLASRPAPAHVCRYLVLHMPWIEGARGAMLAVCQDDGHVEIVGSFGYPRPFVDAHRRLSLFERTPLTDAITKDSTLCFGDTATLNEHYPDLYAGLGGFGDPSRSRGLITVPFVSDAGPVGVLGMSFATPVDRSSPTCQQIATLKPLLTVHLSMLSHSRSEPMLPELTGEGTDVISSTTHGLTKRQMRVLQMLAKKMTNQQIAAAMDYSLSTVRMDTMAIYRALGADGRREAVEKARGMGLITPAASGTWR